MAQNIDWRTIYAMRDKRRKATETSTPKSQQTVTQGHQPTQLEDDLLRYQAQAMHQRVVDERRMPFEAAQNILARQPGALAAGALTNDPRTNRMLEAAGRNALTNPTPGRYEFAPDPTGLTPGISYDTGTGQFVPPQSQVPSMNRPQRQINPYSGVPENPMVPGRNRAMNTTATTQPATRSAPQPLTNRQPVTPANPPMQVPENVLPPVQKWEDPNSQQEIQNWYQNTWTKLTPQERTALLLQMRQAGDTRFEYLRNMMNNSSPQTNTPRSYNSQL